MTAEQRRLVAKRGRLHWTAYFVVLPPTSAVVMTVQAASVLLHGEISVGEFVGYAVTAPFWAGGGAFLYYCHPGWKSWHERRRFLAGRMTPQIKSGVGRIAAPGRHITMARKAPALPPCGVYRFYWVEASPGVRGSLLSAQPLDPEESPDWHDTVSVASGPPSRRGRC
jgi:hypothetical protein